MMNVIGKNSIKGVKIRSWAVLNLVVLVLTGCGGGGGNLTPTPPPPANSAPTVASANADQSATVGESFSYDATQGGSAFNDADGDSLTHTVSFSPDSNGLNATDGRITGTPQAAAVTTVTITADDGNGGSVQDIFTINSSDPMSGNVTISGRVSFDFVPHNSGSAFFSFGLDYNSTVSRSVRGATVQILNQANTVLTSGATDSNGDYLLEAPVATAVRVRVVAELAGFGADWQVQVRDNTSLGALYVLDGGLVDSGNSNAVRNLHAESGWGDSAYTGTRAAAPFAILDNIYDSMQLVQSVDAGVVFAPLTVNWSENNRPTPGDESSGDIGSSFFRQTVNNNVVTNEIYILGAENVDTDEYDRHVIVHEWGHYFESNFSRSDTVGGHHSVDDRLDMRVAFGEGWGTAFAAMVLGDTNYRDSDNRRQASVFDFDIEINTVINPGWYSEASVWAILYDLYDSADESGVDTVSLGFAPIYQVMTNQQRTTPLFTSVFTFITALKEANPGSAGAIDTLVNHHNIVAATMDAEGSTETNNAGNSHALPVYIELPLDGATVNLCMNDTFGTSNKLANIRYLKFTISSQGDYRIEATRSPTGTVAGDPDFLVFSSGVLGAVAGSKDPDSEIRTITDLPAGDYVVEFREFNFFDDITPRDSESCYNITLTTQ